MMKMPGNSFLQLYLLIILLLLATTSMWNYHSFLHMKEKNDSIVTNTIPISQAANDLLMQLVNQETGVHSFLLTGDESFLAPYYAGKKQVYQNLAEIKKYEDQYPFMKQHIDENAAPQIAKMQRYFEKQIALVQSGQT
jgi:methyl-accepting chemotaxis protein